MPEHTSTPDESSAPLDQRRHVRISFSPAQRPRLHLPDGVHDVLDASLGGLRLRHTDPVRPSVGMRAAGFLEWAQRSVLISLSGTIVRVGATDVALACDPGLLPLGHLLSEAAARRDRADEERA